MDSDRLALLLCYLATWPKDYTQNNISSEELSQSPGVPLENLLFTPFYHSFSSTVVPPVYPCSLATS